MIKKAISILTIFLDQSRLLLFNAKFFKFILNYTFSQS